MPDFLLSSFALMAAIIVVTAASFLIGIRSIPNEAIYKRWLMGFLLGLLLWHIMGFISGGLHSELREQTYRVTNTLFNIGLAVTCVSFIQLGYLFPKPALESERAAIRKISVVIALLYTGAIIWYHFLRDQTGASSFTYAAFVNPLAGLFALATTMWAMIVFLRKAALFRKERSGDYVPSLALALVSLVNIAISLLFIYPGTSAAFVLPTYIYGTWITLQAQFIILIIYSPYPVSFEFKMVGFTFTVLMVMLSILAMLTLPFTTNSDDAVNMAQRVADQSTLLRYLWVILGASVFIVLAYPYILRVSLARPLKNLMEGMDRADKGDLDVQVPQGMMDEIGHVTQNFNRMVNSLKQSKLQLTEYANTLEQQVADRTSELRQSLDELKTTQAQLIQAEKMASLGELTAGIAHEIQNPLNFVNNFSDVNTELIGELEEALRQGQAEEAEALLADIRNNSEKIAEHGRRADGIVKSMLQHSHMQSGRKEPIDINALCDEYLRLAYHGYRAREKSFFAKATTDFDPAVGMLQVVRGDIGRVLLNLINNAFHAVDDKRLKSAGDYTPMVNVSTQLRDDQVFVRVTDNASGIPEHLRYKIFQPFFTTKPAGQGTGLGLSLSYDIAKAHGGDLRIEHSGPEGTTFLLVLPAQ